MIIEGILSGDLECWCLLVSKETFHRVTGERPNEKYDVGHFAEKGSPYRYMLYPNHIFGGSMGERKGEVLVISLDVKKKEKEKGKK